MRGASAIDRDVGAPAKAGKRQQVSLRKGVEESSKSCPGRSPSTGESPLASFGATRTAKRRGTNERAGRLSHEIGVSAGAQTVNDVEGYRTPPKSGRGEGAPAGVQGVRRVQKPVTRKLGDLEGASPSHRWQAAVGTRRAVRHGGSLREVRRGHSTEEVGEDVGNARRVDGGKGRGRGEARRRKRVLDPVRDNMRQRNATTGSALGAAVSRSLIRGGSPVREIRSPGSVRGAARKGGPYRDGGRERRSETGRGGS